MDVPMQASGDGPRSSPPRFAAPKKDLAVQLSRFLMPLCATHPHVASLARKGMWNPLLELRHCNILVFHSVMADTVHVGMLLEVLGLGVSGVGFGL